MGIEPTSKNPADWARWESQTVDNLASGTAAAGHRPLFSGADGVPGDSSGEAGFPRMYIDMRGAHWCVTWSDKRRAWVAYPFASAIKAYGPGSAFNAPNVAYGTMYALAQNAADMVDAIEGNIEEARVAAADASRGKSWIWLLALAAGLYYYDKKGRG